MTQTSYVSITVVTERPDAVAMTIDAYHWTMAKLAEAGIAVSMSVAFDSGDANAEDDEAQSE
jgi:hypothetical protein